MTDGLITRIGKWIDYKWAPKATWLDVEKQESRCIERHMGVDRVVERLNAKDELLDKNLRAFQVETIKGVMNLESKINSPSEVSKEIADLKTRFEKLELYLGMSRKVDPSKPPVAKSAFSM